jgi:hypothetical protein
MAGAVVTGRPIPPFRPGRGRAVFACAGLGLFALVQIVLIINAAALAFRIESLDVGAKLGLGDLQVYSSVGNLSAWPLDAAVLLTLFAFSFWLYRADANLAPLGASELRFSPLFAALSMFIPLANLILVLFVVREIYKGSEPELTTNNRWGRAGVRVWRGIWVWWVTLLSGLFLSMVSVVVVAVVNAGGRLSLSGFDDLLWFEVIVNSVYVVSAVAGILVVLGIDWRLRERHRMLIEATPATGWSS